MAKKLKLVRRFNQNYRNFIFSEMLPEADDEYLELVVEMDDNGNVLTESKFDSVGELEEKNTYTYADYILFIVVFVLRLLTSFISIIFHFGH